MILFSFFSLSFSFLDKFTGQWNVYESYPTSNLYTVSISKNEEILNRFEATIFTNIKYDNKNPLSLDDAFISEFYIDIDNNDKNKGFAFDELPENKIFDFSYSAATQTLNIENSVNNLKYTIYFNPNDSHNERMKTLFKSNNPIFFCQVLNGSNLMIQQNLYVQKVEEPSTFDLLNYLGLLAMASVIIILFQAYNFFKNWKKAQEKYSFEMKQKMLKQMSEKQRQERLGEQENDKEENNNETTSQAGKFDEEKLIRRKLIQEKENEKITSNDNNKSSEKEKDD